MKTLQTLAGIILVVAGLVFAGQGSRYFPYPAESFMVGDVHWIYYGGAITVAGMLLLVIARR